MQIVEGLAVLRAAPELGGLRAQSVVGRAAPSRAPGRYPRDSLFELPQFLALAEAKDLVNDLDHRPCLSIDESGVPQ